MDAVAGGRGRRRTCPVPKLRDGRRMERPSRPIVQEFVVIRSSVVPALVLSAFTAGLAIGRHAPSAHATAAGSAAPSRVAPHSVAPRVFELRTYTTPPGRLPVLERRFREHTMAIFTRHGMTNIGYWTPQDSARAGTTLVYLLAHQSREDAARSWAAFGADPEWRRVQAASEADGKVVERVESVFLTPTDYSPLR